MKKVIVLSLMMLFSVSVFANPEVTFQYDQRNSTDSEGNHHVQDCQTTCQNDMCSTYCL